MCIKISYRNYAFRMCKELCLGWGFSYLLVRISPTFNNEVFGLVVVLNGGKICIEKMLGFRGDAVRFLKLMFLFWP